VLQLQSAAGNAATSRLLQRVGEARVGPVLPKLRAGIEVGGAPEVGQIPAGSTGDPVLTLAGNLTAKGAVVIGPASKCPPLTVGFLQVMRPFSIARAIYRFIDLHKDVELSISNGLRKAPGVADVHEDGWAGEPVKGHCGSRAEVSFWDRPDEPFWQDPNPIPSGEKLQQYRPIRYDWERYFLTTLAVKSPMGLTHLKSFYWDVKYSESFEVSRGSYLGPSRRRDAKVIVGGPIDGDPGDGALSVLTGAPTGDTANALGEGIYQTPVKVEGDEGSLGEPASRP
jgi:hypothetical protein